MNGIYSLFYFHTEIQQPQQHPTINVSDRKNVPISIQFTSTGSSNYYQTTSKYTVQIVHVYHITQSTLALDQNKFSDLI